MRAGISTPVEKRITIHVDVDWMKKLRVRGVVIGNHVYFRDQTVDITPALLRHELEHCYQIIRNGRIRFYLKYFFYQLRYGYKGNPFELEAHQRQNDLLTPQEETLLWNLRDS